MGAKRATLSALTIAALLAAPGPAWAQSADVADRLWAQAEQHQAQGRQIDAAEAFVRSAEAERACPSPRWKDYAAAMVFAAECRLRAGQPDDAFPLFDACLATLQAASQSD